MDLTKEIQAFCDKELHRYDLTRPWELPDGRLAASDGRALVVCQSEVFLGSVASKAAKVPNIKALLADHGAARGWKRVPELPPCKTCNCLGVVFPPGPECDDGPPAPEQCSDPGCAIETFGRRLARAYVNCFTVLPNCRWAIAPRGKAEDHVFFEFTGGIGILNRLGDT